MQYYANNVNQAKIKYGKENNIVYPDNKSLYYSFL